MKSILVFGSGGHAKVVVDIIEKEGKYQIEGLIDYSYNADRKISGYKIIGNDSSIKNLVKKNQIYGGIIAVADNAIRSKIRDKIVQSIPQFKFINCIHPSSIIAKDVVIGDGNVFMAGTIINSSSIIKNNCIVNTNSSIDHDNVLNDFSCIAPNVALGGSVTIGRYTFVGIGSNVLPNINLGSNCIIGGGSLVCSDTKNNSLYYGSPAKFIRSHKFGERY